MFEDDTKFTNEITLETGMIALCRLAWHSKNGALKVEERGKRVR
jgi:hypothetical protein